MATYVVTSLYYSRLCRLCGSENADGNGIYLYDNDNELKEAINKYLPIKVDDDGKLPRTICPGCHIQLASTKQFFDLLVEGQSRLRELYTQELAVHKSLERNTKVALLSNETANESDILIKIFPDDSFYSEDHELSLKVEGLEKPRRKRGRPRKVRPPPEEDITQIEDPPVPIEETLETDFGQSKDEDEDFGEDDVGRRRRRRKLPQRLLETVAGKELDRILREEGAIDEFESDESVHEETPPTVEVSLEEAGDLETLETAIHNGEIIGHLTAPDGSIAEAIVAPPSGRGPYRKRKLHKFICDFCNQAFRDRTKWIRHRLVHKGCRFQCSDVSCLLLFTSKSKLNTHQAETEHTGMDVVMAVDEPPVTATEDHSKFFCVSCGQEFASAIELATHVETDHSIDKEEQDPKMLDLEGIPTETKDELQQSQSETEPLEETSYKVSMNGKHQCDECSRSFNHASSLIYHKESSHNDGRRFVCVKCNKSFNHKQLLQRHQMVHSDIRPFSCSKCGMSFKTKSNLFNHRVVHTGEKNFSCDTCDQQFAHKTSLNLHKSWHQGIRPFKCNYCSKCFTQSGNLREHMRIHNGEKPFKCSYCGKEFTTSSQHRLHLKRHTGDRPWKCQYCDKHFLHKDTWKTHERRHTGEKPFQCSYCSRGFAEHWSLKKHIRLHTGEKPYKCQVCGKEFADCSNLTKHKKVHGVPAANMEQSQVWNLIKTHLASDPATTDDMKQVIFVTYQDSEDKDGSQLEDTESQHLPTSEEQPDTQNNGNTMTFLDEEGNPVQLALPDGKTVEIVSLDTESNIVQVRTSEGWTILMQLPQNREIVEEEMLEHIRLAVAEARSTELAETTEAVTKNVYADGEEFEAATTTFQTSNVYTAADQSVAEGIQFQLEDENVTNQELVQKTPQNVQQAYTLRLAKPMELVGDFNMEALKEEFLVTE